MKETVIETGEKIFSQFDFREMNQFLEKIFPNDKIEFGSFVKGVISGDLEFTLELFWKMISDQFVYELANTKTSIIHILIIVIIAAIFYNFSGVFLSEQVSEMSFYALYMLLITICLNAFRILISSALYGLGNMLEFLSLLGPVYFMAVAIATGSATSVAFYNMVLILVCIVEIVIQDFLIPLVKIYMLIKVVNGLSKEEFLSKFGELLHTVIQWTLKILLGGVIGINFIQGMLTPAIDAVKRSVFARTGEALPFVGDALGGATEVVLGTAVLIKNGIGVAGAVICVVICMSPVIQMAVISFMYKLVAAMTQPISDKRLIGCISSMSDGAGILLRIIFTSGVLFLITIAMVASSTS